MEGRVSDMLILVDTCVTFLCVVYFERSYMCIQPVCPHSLHAVFPESVSCQNTLGCFRVRQAIALEKKTNPLVDLSQRFVQPHRSDVTWYCSPAAKIDIFDFL